MKKLSIFAIASMLGFTLQAQEFAKQLSEARTAYTTGKLDDSRFAMQQMLQELDIVMGKEMLKTLPSKLQDLNANVAKDNVSGASGFLGVVIHRDYGTATKNAELEIISNSPVLTSINALLSIPLMGNTGDNKVVKVAGYKALLQKVSGDNEQNEFELQVPLNASLLTLKAPGFTQEQLMQLANTLPIGEIAKKVQ